MTISIQEFGLILRFIERISILIICVFIIKQGVKLLLKSIEGNSQIEYEGVLGKFKITNVATGVVLIAMAIVILGFSLNKVFEYSESASNATAQAENPPANPDKQIPQPRDSNAGTALTGDTSGKQKKQAPPGSSHSTTVKYDNSSTGIYTGPIIKESTIKQLFDKLKYLEDNSSKIDRPELRDLIDIYDEIYSFNIDNKRSLNKNYSSENLK